MRGGLVGGAAQDHMEPCSHREGFDFRSKGDEKPLEGSEQESNDIF